MEKKPTLVQNKKVTKFPTSPKRVSDALKIAQDLAHKDGWKRVIILGESDHNGTDIFSKMLYSQKVAMLEGSKHLILKEWLE